MTPSAQQRSQAQQAERWRLHSRCEAELRQTGPHWGIYCATHNQWIQWIRRNQVPQLVMTAKTTINDGIC